MRYLLVCLGEVVFIDINKNSRTVIYYKCRLLLLVPIRSMIMI